MYRCKECNLAVIVADGTIIRACTHDDAGIVAELSATMHGSGGVTA